MTVPYAAADSKNARAEIEKILRGFGCTTIGFMEDYEHHTVILAFKHRGRSVQLTASAVGWAELYLKSPPTNHAKRLTREQALDQGVKAVNSILRDWVKGQVTAIECGVLSFEGVFLPYMLGADGRPLIDQLQLDKLLPPPKG